VQPHNTLCLNAHYPKIPYNMQMDSYLHRLGLYQMVIMGDCQLDKPLLTMLVERWRSETSMFHLATSRRDDGDTGGCVAYGDCLLVVFYF
jgi:hypothetical protein